MTKLQDDVLAGSRPKILCRSSSRTDVVRRQQNDCKIDTPRSSPPHFHLTS
jgi:hypothetical protein